MCMNIQVENPVLILNQDAARSFLKDCDPKKLYSFFMKATQLESIIEKLNSCVKIALTSKNRLETIGKSIELGESEIEILREKHTRLRSVNQMQQRIVECKNEIEWLKIVHAEKELMMAQNNLAKTRDELKKVQDVINNKSKYEKETKEKIRELGTQIEVLKTEAEEKSKIYERTLEPYESERDKLSGSDNNLKIWEKRLETMTANVQTYLNDIHEYENNPENVENLRRENQAKINEFENMRKDIGIVLQNAKRDHQMFVETLNEHKEHLEELKQKNQRENEMNLRLDQQIAQYKRAGKDRMLVYGVSMTNLLNDIEQLNRRKKFSALPRGPIGRYVEVTDRKYLSAVENHLGATLRAFIVNSDEDRILLNETKSKYKDLRNIPIISCKFQNQVYDIRSGKARIDDENGVKVMSDVIQVSDPVVMNCLIDQKSIECIVLVDDTQKAINLTQDEENVPENLNFVILLNPYSQFYPAPNYRTYSMQENPPKFIQTNTRDLVKGVEEQKKRNQNRISNIQNEIKNTQIQVKDHEKLVVDKKRVMNELNGKLESYSKQIEELKSIEYPQEEDIEYKRKMLEEESQKQKQIEKKFSQMKEKHEVLKQIVDKCKRKMEEAQNDHRKTREKFAEAQQGIEVAQMQLDEMKRDITIKSNQVQMIREREAENVKILREFQDYVSRLTSAAPGIRVECKRSQDAIEMEIKQLNKRIERIQANNENVEDIGLLLENKIKNVEDTKKIFSALDNLLKRVRIKTCMI